MRYKWSDFSPLFVSMTCCPWHKVFWIKFLLFLCNFWHRPQPAILLVSRSHHCCWFGLHRSCRSSWFPGKATGAISVYSAGSTDLILLFVMLGFMCIESLSVPSLFVVRNWSIAMAVPWKKFIAFLAVGLWLILSNGSNSEHTTLQCCWTDTTISIKLSKDSIPQFCRNF